jgi:hypothetical protein
MPMCMMCVGHVLVLVLYGLVAMDMRVDARDGWFMRVRMVAVIVGVGVLVHDRVMTVPVDVSLGDMQQESNGHRNGGEERARRERLPQHDRGPCGEKGSHAEHGGRTRSPDASLRQDVQAKTRAVTGGSAHQQAGAAPEPVRDLAQFTEGERQRDG